MFLLSSFYKKHRFSSSDKFLKIPCETSIKVWICITIFLKKIELFHHLVVFGVFQFQQKKTFFSLFWDCGGDESENWSAIFLISKHSWHVSRGMEKFMQSMFWWNQFLIKGSLYELEKS